MSARGDPRGVDAEGGDGGRARGSDRRGADDEEVGGADVVRERAVAPAEAGGGAADVDRVDLGVGLAERVADVGVCEFCQCVMCQPRAQYYGVSWRHRMPSSLAPSPLRLSSPSSIAGFFARTHAAAGSRVRAPGPDIWSETVFKHLRTLKLKNAVLRTRVVFGALASATTPKGGARAPLVATGTGLDALVLGFFTGVVLLCLSSHAPASRPAPCSPCHRDPASLLCSLRRALQRMAGLDFLLGFLE